MNDLPIKLGASIAGFLLGLFTKFGSAWIDDHFKQKAERRGKIEDFMAEITNIMSEAIADGYKTKPNANNKSKMFKAAAQIERLEEQNTAHTIRDFTNKWDIYCNSVIDLGDGGAVIYNGVDQKASREELDRLADKILGKRF